MSKKKETEPTSDSAVGVEKLVMQKAYGSDIKRVIEIYLDNAQSQPKISVIDNGKVDCNLPISRSILNGIFPETDRILLQRLLVKPDKEGYKIDADMQISNRLDCLVINFLAKV